MRLDAHPREPFEPGSLGDPVAKTTEWTPCKRGGSNFCTHVLVRRGPGRVAFRPTVGAIFFYVLFLAFGVFALVFGLAAASAKNGNAGPFLVLLVFGLVFGGVGVSMTWSGTRPIVFDRTIGMFWKGWGTPQQGKGTYVQLGDVHALQVISEYCASKHSFYSYELNLVLADGSRMNVVDHGDLARIRQDGAVLADFLGLPLWDPV